MFDFSPERLLSLLYALPGVLFALSVHEFSHGYVAYKLGDNTAKFSGRLTLNPIRHLNLLGFICMIVAGFGWANPVPVNTRFFKKPKRDLAFVALAGPVSNLLSAFVGMILYFIFLRIAFSNASFINEKAVQGMIYIFSGFISVNIGLAVFNLIPIPPLDGSRILDAFLPTKLYLAYHKYEQIISIVLFVLIMLDVISVPISGAINWIYNGMYNILRFILII